MGDGKRYNTPSKGTEEWHKPLNENFEQLETDVEIRDKTERRDEYEPKDGAKFFATNTGKIYLGDGETWNRVSIAGEADESRPRNRVYDTSGRYHGELTGNNDASVVNDAIEDRQGTQGIVVPDPGFPLEWEQQVTLPSAERGFSIESDGFPRLQTTANYDGECGIYKPPHGGDKTGCRDYRIGEFFFDDSEEVLDWGLYIDDTKGGVIRPCVFEDCPGIYIGATNWWSNQNIVQRPNIRSARGPGIELERFDPNLYNNGGSDADQEADQNWIIAPYYSEKRDRSPGPEEYTETAYRDHGRGNMWLLTRCEFASQVHHQLGANRYVIIEGQWDRSGRYDNTVVEQWDNELDGDPASATYGTIISHKAEHFALSRLINSNTRMKAPGRRHRTVEPIGLSTATTAHSLQSLGLRDNSDSGDVRIEPGSNTVPTIAMRTDGGYGDTAVLDSGPATWGSMEIAPKLFMEAEVDANDGVLVRVGFYSSEDDHCELIYDPTGKLGSAPGDQGNWYIQLKSDGTVRAQEDAKVHPYSWGRRLILQREQQRASANWSVHLEHGADNSNDHYSHDDRVYERTVVSNDGNPVADDGRFRFRVYLRALDDSEKVFKIKTRRKLQVLTN